MTDNDVMQVTNLTTIPAHIIAYFLRDLGISKAGGSITIQYGDTNGRGLCHRSGVDFTLTIDVDATLDTLAHELKHVEQHVSGLTEWMKVEREVTEYAERWHEVEAREYAQAWTGKRY